MDYEYDSIDALLVELNQNSGSTVVTTDDFKKVEKEINAKMTLFSIEQRSYFNRSVQSASKAYLTF